LPPPQIEERVEAALQHLRLGLDWKGAKLGVVEIRRHYSNYFRGIHGFKEHRTKLVTADRPEEVEALLAEIVDKYAEHVY